jgi:phenylpropionate dioxygenase-like ring-hydroxylating dioxygenase large terminal subunit
VPVGRDTDPAFLALEDRYLWRKSGRYALRADELATPGSFRVWTKTGSPIVLVRGTDDKIRAFSNACRHRGPPLVEAPQGQTQGFFCRYHGWTYDLTGRLTAVHEKRDFRGLDLACKGLKEVRCEQFGPRVFIDEASDAPPLLGSLGPIPTHLANLQPKIEQKVQATERKAN